MLANKKSFLKKKTTPDEQQLLRQGNFNPHNKKRKLRCSKTIFQKFKSVCVTSLGTSDSVLEKFIPLKLIKFGCSPVLF